MTNSSAESKPDVSLVGLGGWFVFLWGVSQVFSGTWKSPLSFDGWFGFVLSMAAWVVVGLPTVGILVLYITAEQKTLLKMSLEFGTAVAGWGLVFLGLVASLHFINRETNVGAPALTVVAERSTGDPLESGIEKLRDRQVKLGTLIGELEGERSRIVDRLGQAKRDSKDDAQPIYAHELLEIDRYLKQLTCEAEDVALTVAKGESLLRKTDRQKRLHDAGIDSSEMNELAVLRVEIEERLKSDSVPRSAGEAIQIDKVIREALGGKR